MSYVRDLIEWYAIAKVVSMKPLIECETAHCTCCSEKDHDINIVKDEQEIQDMEICKEVLIVYN